MFHNVARSYLTDIIVEFSQSKLEIFLFFSVGVWHNFVLCIAALAFLFLLPVFLFPVYSTGAGALVTEVVQVSAVGFYLIIIDVGDTVLTF